MTVFIQSGRTTCHLFNGRRLADNLVFSTLQQKTRAVTFSQSGHTRPEFRNFRSGPIFWGKETVQKESRSFKSSTHSGSTVDGLNQMVAQLLLRQGDLRTKEIFYRSAMTRMTDHPRPYSHEDYDWMQKRLSEIRSELTAIDSDMRIIEVERSFVIPEKE